MGYLARLLDILLPPRDAERLVRELQEESFFALVSPRVLTGGAVALLPYQHPSVRAVITEAKFGRNRRAISLLGRALADYVASRLEETAAFGTGHIVFVPVPLGDRRRAERGYNQVELILEAAQLPAAGVLERIRETAPQTALSRHARVANMHGAFAARHSLDPSSTYIVVDDVTTTGSTLDAALTALRAAGAHNSTKLALAY